MQRLAYQSEAAIYQDFTIPPLTQTVEELEEDFIDHIFLKAYVDGQIIGSVRARLHNDTCYIGRLIVHPDFQGSGIGTKLMNEIEHCVAGAARFELFTGYKSERNLYLYRKLGYRKLRDEAVGNAPTLVFMEKIVA